MTHDATDSPAPDRTRRGGGSEPTGLADRTDVPAAGRYGMTALATAVYDALQETRYPLDMAVAALLGAAQGTAPADRWQRCADQIELARWSLDQAAAMLIAARPDESNVPSS